MVEGAHDFAVKLKEKYPDLDVTESFFEKFVPTQKYKNIILGHVLEHVDDPELVLTLCKDWLEDDGKILAAVPNANSIHRQAAVKMKLLDSIYSFSEKDRRHGHQRVFDMDLLSAVFANAGLNIQRKGGYWLKPLSDSQINSYWNEQMIDAFLELGEEYASIAREIYIIAGK